jgi:hypothetical protein
MKGNNFRLPNTVNPLNYELFFDIDLTNFSFYGREKIDLKITNPTRNIILNSSDLDIKNANLIYKNEILIPEIKIDEKYERVYLSFDKKISEGLSLLTIEFSGKLREDLIGLYKSNFKYANDRRERKWK